MPLIDNHAPQARGTFLNLTTVRNALVVAMIVWFPFAYLYVTPVETHSPHLVARYLLRTTLVGPLDVVLLLLAVLSLPLLVRRDTYRGLPIALIGALAFASVTIAFVLPSPTAEGVLRGIRLAGVAGAIATIRWMPMPTFRGAVVWPLTIGAGIQAAWALAQTFIWNNGHVLGSGSSTGRVWTRGYGAMDGAYALAAFMVLAIAVILSAGAFRRLHPVMWASVVLASAAVATTFGRSGVLAVGLVGAVYGLGWLIKHTKEYFFSAAAAIVPMVAGIAASWPGWQPRAAATSTGYQSGREALLRRAFEIIEAHPIFGVGPGEYGPALARMGLTQVDTTIVHNVPVLIAAEYGVPIGVLFTIWLGLLGLAALFTSVRATAVFVAILPYLYFDNLHMVYVNGIVGFGLWLAVMDYHRLHKNSTTEGDAAPVEVASAATG